VVSVAGSRRDIRPDRRRDPLHLPSRGMGSERDIEQNATLAPIGRAPDPGRLPFPLRLVLLAAVAIVTGPGCTARDTGGMGSDPSHTVSTSIQVAIATQQTAGDPARATKSLGPIAGVSGGLPNLQHRLHASIGERGVPGRGSYNEPLPRIARDPGPFSFLLLPDLRVPSPMGPSPYVVFWGVAQSVEHQPDKLAVVGSNPSAPTNLISQ
jgi:hypothetical protein